MRRQSKKTNRRFKTTGFHTPPKTSIREVEIEPEKLAGYVRQAEEYVLPMIKETDLGPCAAQLLLAICTQVLASGSDRILPESALAIANAVLALWQDGYYTPSSAYPYTLEETLADLQRGLSAKANYAECFQPFRPTQKSSPRGLGEIAGGIVQHPKTRLWQIWIVTDASPCVFFGAYADPVRAQRGLEKLIETSRKGATPVEGLQLALRLDEQGDGASEQLPYDMVVYLIEHLDCYSILL
jgi:hypothetical protein